ncbi:MAG TPA: hypothetical protein VGQ33_07630, partial [Vicinamibacteria bacterium]|nr:hypothetical protein [Vicinamibacteria bacterium]
CTWGGGGRFLGPRKVGLWTSMPLLTHPDHPLVGLEAVSAPAKSAGPEFMFLSPRISAKEWSGRDQAGEEVFTSAGKLFRKRRGGTIEIADFNGLEPDPQPAPAWAARPLPPLRRSAPRRPAHRGR